MKYISTRGTAPVLEFDDVLLAGLARDGGLYVPQSWPQFDADKFRSLQNLSYAELAFEVIKPYVGDRIADADLKRILDGAYANFDTAEVAPLKKLGDNEYLLELFHGYGHAVSGAIVRSCSADPSAAHNHSRCHLGRYRISRH